MARKLIIDNLMRLAQSIGANPNKFMGTKQNINFLGTGDRGMKGTTFSGAINDDFLNLGFGRNDLIKIIEQDMGYVTAGKLNDFQLKTMENNLNMINKTFNPPPGPKNVIDLETGTGALNKEGLESLRDTDKIQRFTQGLRTSKTAMTDKIMEGIEGLKTKIKAPFNIRSAVDDIERIEKNAAEKSFRNTGAADWSDSIQAEGARRAVVREAIKNNPQVFNLPPEMVESIVLSKDLGKGGSKFADPLVVFRNIGQFTNDELAKIDDIIERSPFDEPKFISEKVMEYITDIRPEGFKPMFAEGGRIGYRSGRSVKGILDILKLTNKKFGKDTLKIADEIDRPEAALLADEFAAFNERTAVPAMEGQFTKAEVVIERMKNSIKGNPNDKYVQETFPKMIKELEAKPELANNPNVWKMFSEDMPKNQRLVEHSDGSISFFRQTEFGPRNIKLSMDFAKKHDLTLEEASRILKMEPEDQILEITRVKATRNMAKGGLARILEM